MNKILVANRGEIARRIMATCRRLGIETVAVFSDFDRHARFVFEADEAVPLGGLTAAESYLRIEAILEAARLTKADAVHPGYGFLAESAEFADACREAGLTFIGPAAATIAAMGSKIESKRLMTQAGVPVVPSLGIEDLSEADLGAAGDGLGWPLLVKASAGGGGKGMRLVASRAELADSIRAARREASASFGDDTVYLEQYLPAPRHVEVQIVGDTYGRVVHLYERECSIQRRYQKIIEESPSPGLSAELRREILAAAVAAGEAIGYEGAGTVEFLVAHDGSFFFLEMNTRLQVEHPVTEAVTGLDLVQMQIDVARGDHLPEQSAIPPCGGHAIEVRLYAEDPANDFLPATGTLHQFRIPREGVRVDAGVYDGVEIGIHYDPMLAKIIAHGRTREEAARRLAEALGGAVIHGVQTNRALLVRVLRHPDFLAGDIDTHFLQRHSPAELAAPLTTEADGGIHALAAALADQAARRDAAPVLGAAPTGWRNNPSQLQRVSFRRGGEVIDIGYRFSRTGIEARIGDEAVSVSGVEAESGHVEMTVAGVHRRYRVSRAGGRHFVDSALGSTDFIEVDRFPAIEEESVPGSLKAPMPGVVRRVDVTAGEVVAVGDLLLVLEAMKMEHNVLAPVAGTVQLRATVGEQVEAGRVLAVIETDQTTDG
ncbi:MAG: ATP-grasp domain-containing protein [Acidimicrobiia bacterium]|nr:ATP-grasp domain-containing protein [Acidimicrobiia bacterium]